MFWPMLSNSRIVIGFEGAGDCNSTHKSYKYTKSYIYRPVYELDII